MDIIKHLVSALLLSLLASAANADPVVYEIEIGYGAEGFQASYLHGSTGCRRTGPNTGDTLYMCGSPLDSITGRIEGDLIGGLLQITGGSIHTGSDSYRIFDGRLGSFGGNYIWWFTMEHYGEFWFESIAMGAGKPNFFDGHTMILWGQNMSAYNRYPGTMDHRRRGIDIYARKISVPEPGTLSLIGLGLLGAGLARRRRTI